jgi:hypothetical protein
MGDDDFTLGRPHPMIDSTIRNQRILKEGQDPTVAVILLDFILGFNASKDPVGELLDSILVAKQTREEQGGELTVVASICGTVSAPQDLNLQNGNAGECWCDRVPEQCARSSLLQWTSKGIIGGSNAREDQKNPFRAPHCD